LNYFTTTLLHSNINESDTNDVLPIKDEQKNNNNKHADSTTNDNHCQEESASAKEQITSIETNVVVDDATVNEREAQYSTTREEMVSKLTITELLTLLNQQRIRYEVNATRNDLEVLLLQSSFELYSKNNEDEDAVVLSSGDDDDDEVRVRQRRVMKTMRSTTAKRNRNRNPRQYSDAAVEWQDVRAGTTRAASRARRGAKKRSAQTNGGDNFDVLRPVKRVVYLTTNAAMAAKEVLTTAADEVPPGERRRMRMRRKFPDRRARNEQDEDEDDDDNSMEVIVDATIYNPTKPQWESKTRTSGGAASRQRPIDVSPRRPRPRRREEELGDETEGEEIVDDIFRDYSSRQRRSRCPPPPSPRQPRDSVENYSDAEYDDYDDEMLRNRRRRRRRMGGYENYVQRDPYQHLYNRERIPRRRQRRRRPTDAKRRDGAASDEVCDNNEDSGQPVATAPVMMSLPAASEELVPFPDLGQNSMGINTTASNVTAKDMEEEEDDENSTSEQQTRSRRARSKTASRTRRSDRLERQPRRPTSKRRRNVSDNDNDEDDETVFDMFADFVVNKAEEARKRTDEWVMEGTEPQKHKRRYWKDKLAEGVDYALGVHDPSGNYTSWSRKLEEDERNEASFARDWGMKPRQLRKRMGDPSYWDDPGSLVGLLFGRTADGERIAWEDIFRRDVGVNICTSTIRSAFKMGFIFFGSIAKWASCRGALPQPIVVFALSTAALSAPRRKRRLTVLLTLLALRTIAEALHGYIYGNEDWEDDVVYNEGGEDNWEGDGMD